MDIQTHWPVVLWVAAPVAGVVGFALQLRQVTKARLEIEKLQLEVIALRDAAKKQEQRVQVATLEETLRFRDGGDIMFRRGGPNPGPDDDHVSRTSPLAEWLVNAGAILLVLAFLGYLGYDLYRLGRWIVSLF